jgi:hypothetical protein
MHMCTVFRRPVAVGVYLNVCRTVHCAAVRVLIQIALPAGSLKNLC